MSSYAADDRIVQGKNLLKKYQSRQLRDKHLESSREFDCINGTNSDIKNNSTNSLQNLSIDVDDSCSTIHGNSWSRESSRPPSFSGSAIETRKEESKVDESKSTDTIILQRLLAEKDQLLSATTNKLHSLHKHYSELHKHYSELCARTPNEFTDQIKQLHIALNIEINEKKNLQSELRILHQKLRAVEVQSKLFEDSKACTEVTTSPDSEKFEGFEEEKLNLLDTISNQSKQLDMYRKNCSDLEAEILVVQQDKRDTQARLKHLYEEKVTTEKNLQLARNELNMRDIYIKQLSHNHCTDSDLSNVESLNTIKGLKDSISNLELTIQTNKSTISELKAKIQEEKDQFHTSIGQQVANVAKLEEELSQIKHEKMNMESSKNFVEQELSLLRQKYEQMFGTNRSEEHETKQINPLEVEKLKNTTMYFENLCTEYGSNILELKDAISSRDEQTQTLQNALCEATQRILSLEHEKAIASKLNENVQHLSEQLQNERTTVSRAVAQNQELKAQLIELQDRFVQLTNDCAEKEDERITSLATIERLRHQIEDINALKKENSLSDSTNASFFAEQRRTNSNSPSTECPSTPVVPTFVNNQAVQTDACPVALEQLKTDNLYPNQMNVTSDAQQATILTQEANKHNENCKMTDEQQDENQAQIELTKKLERLSDENKEFRLSNEKLQYWLTALESENESIGEYIALYRFQRCNIQKRLSEKDMCVQKLQQRLVALFEQLKALSDAVNPLFQNYRIENSQDTRGENSVMEVDEATNHITLPDQEATRVQVCDGQNISSLDPAMKNLFNLLVRCNQFIATEDIPTYSNLCSKTEEIRCSGCLECRGDFVTL